MDREDLDTLVPHGVEAGWAQPKIQGHLAHFRRPDESKWGNLVDGDLTAIDDTRAQVFAVAELLGVSPGGLSIVNESDVSSYPDYLDDEDIEVSE